MRHLIVFGLSAALASAVVACGDDPIVDPTGSGGAGAQGAGGTGAGASGAGGPGGGGSGGGGACGNGEIDAGEDCDGADLGDETCVSLGFGEGTLSCSATCAFDDSQCPAAPTCGDDVINGTDACDGDELGTATCEGEGFDGGDLACDSRCQLDTAGCCDHACNDGDTQCNGDAVEICALGASGCFEWTLDEDCAATPGLTCDPSTVSCEKAGTICTTAVDLTSATLPLQLTGGFGEDPTVGSSCYSTPYNGVWFKYTAPTTDTYVISLANATTGSAYTRFAVFETDACAPYGTEVNCGNTFAKVGGIEADMTMGQTYLILVHTEGNNSLMVDPEIDIKPLPAGGTCTTAVDLTAATFPVTLDGHFPIDPAVVGSCDTTPTNVVWFSYTAQLNGTTHVRADNDSISGFWSRLAIFDGLTCSPLGTQIACITQSNQNAVNTTFTATMGTSYLFGFYTDSDGYSMVDPTISIKEGVPAGWTCSPFSWDDGVCDCGCGIIDPDCGVSPTIASCDVCCGTDVCPQFVDATDITLCDYTAGNTCVDPLPLVSGSFPWQGASNNFVTAGSTGCTGYPADGVDRVHVVTLAAGETLTVSLTPTAGDAAIYLITNCADSANSCVEGSDNTSSGAETLVYTSVAGGTYYFVADRYSSGTTTAGYTLSVDIQ